LKTTPGAVVAHHFAIFIDHAELLQVARRHPNTLDGIRWNRFDIYRRPLACADRSSFRTALLTVSILPATVAVGPSDF
jgi:hypothetical protein